MNCDYLKPGTEVMGLKVKEVSITYPLEIKYTLTTSSGSPAVVLSHEELIKLINKK